MRYFIIFYTGRLGKDVFHGNICFESECFPWRDRVSVEIQELYGYDDVCLTNVKEVSQDDYEQWNG